MKNNKGISMITLVVTIIVMLILIGVVGTSSLDTIEKGYQAVDARELANVRSFVLAQQMAVEMDEFTSFPDNVLTADELYLVADGKLSENELNDIVDVNTSLTLGDKYKYYYIQASTKYFERPEFARNSISVQDVTGDYIVNFYTGTVIAISSNEAKVDGLVKGLHEILAEI